eukprot:6863183-Lingulodinium_polyedra.AAC.1
MSDTPTAHYTSWTSAANCAFLCAEDITACNHVKASHSSPSAVKSCSSLPTSETESSDWDTAPTAATAPPAPPTVFRDHIFGITGWNTIDIP